MKKILAVILSLAMILSMTVCAFAAEAPSADADSNAWAAYYTEILMDEELDNDAKAEAILNNIPAADDNTVLLNALGTAVATAEAQGVDISAVAAIVVVKSEEAYGFNIEDAAGTDIDGDGYIGTDKKPVSATDVEGWTAYYTLLLGRATTDASSIASAVSAIGGTLIKGEIDRDTFMSAFPAAVRETGSDVANQVLWGVEELIKTDINSDGYIGKPDGSIDDGKLPAEDDNNSGSGILGSLSGIFDTVLGVLGSIFDTIFGGGSETPSNPSEPGDDNLWPGEDDPWPGPGGDDSTVPNMGDTTVFAVAAVALAAGAALVMTRKKSEDAE